jgi:hypothetical protein
MDATAGRTRGEIPVCGRGDGGYRRKTMNDSSTPGGVSDVDLPVLRARLAALYRNVADTLDESAQLAEGHAERWRATGQCASVDAELEIASRARAAAERGRAAALRLAETR